MNLPMFHVKHKPTRHQKYKLMKVEISRLYLIIEDLTNKVDAYEKELMRLYDEKRMG